MIKKTLTTVKYTFLYIMQNVLLQNDEEMKSKSALAERTINSAM